MPRIFKGSESTLRLLISKTGDYQALTEIKIKLYTTDIENAIEIIDGIQVCKNIAIITLAPRAFMGMEDGLINYIIDGATEDDVFHTERQSNYMLKSLSYINEDGVATQTMTIESNGEYRVTPNDGLYVDINVNVPDLNGSYDDGFNVGYGQGKTDGEQAGYNSGYSQGQADIAANARVLNVTENGNYLSKYSDPIIPTLVTGVYADGTDFYSYAELGNKVFNTKIAGTVDSRLEFWYKGDNIGKSDGWDVIIGSGDIDNSDCFQVRYFMYDNNKLQIEVGNSKISVDNWDDTVWHHFIISKAEGLWIDGEKKWDFSPSNTINGEFLINGIGYNNVRNANGTFGMIKIDDVVIIPTADGFQNVNTGGLLEVVKNGTYKFTENVIKYGEGELYKTINVNVPPKINVKEARLRFGCSRFTEVPEWADFEGVTDMESIFNDCQNIKTIPQIDTSNVTNMRTIFYNCINLQTIPPLNTSNVVNMKEMFSQCKNLQTIPSLDTSKVTEMYNMFHQCFSLVSIPAINAQSLNMPSYFGVFGYSDLPNITDFGGFLNLKLSLTNDGNLKRLPNLTYESCINVLNGLYDFTGNGETPGSNQGQLKVHQNFLDKVGEEISIGTNKGWQITV